MLEIGLRQGLYFKHPGHDPEERQRPAGGHDPRQARGRAAGAQAVFIDAGYGTGIYSCGQVVAAATGSWCGSAASRRTSAYVNKRAQMWGMRQGVAEGRRRDRSPRTTTLYQDLIGPETVGRVGRQDPAGDRRRT
jgi:hypothetical protein